MSRWTWVFLPGACDGFHVWFWIAIETFDRFTHGHVNMTCDIFVHRILVDDFDIFWRSAQAQCKAGDHGLHDGSFPKILTAMLFQWLLRGSKRVQVTNQVLRRCIGKQRDPRKVQNSVRERFQLAWVGSSQTGSLIATRMSVVQDMLIQYDTSIHTMAY